MRCIVPTVTEGEGVAMYVRDVYTSLLLPDVSICESYLECACLEAVSGKKRYFLASIYRPPNGNFPDFINGMINILEYISSKNYSAVFCMGDWNINVLNQNDSHVKDFINLMFSYFLLPTTTKPTRIFNNSASLFDLIWTNQVELNIGNYIMYINISDLFPVVSRFRECSLPAQQERCVYRRIFSHGNVDRFVYCMTQLSWGEVLQSNCPNTAYNKFHDKYIEVFQNNFPLKRMKQKTCSNTTPYLTQGLIRSIKEKLRLTRLPRK